MTPLSQRNPVWGNKYLGFSNTYVRDFGCVITSLSMILGTTPDVVNDRLKAVQGFANGNLVIWSKIPEAFPGISQRRVWSYNNDDVKNNVPNVMVEVPPNAIGGVSGKHWEVFIGNQECLDPCKGSKRPANDFLKYGDATVYCVSGGKWEQPSSEPMATITQKELDSIIKARNAHWDALQAKISELNVLENDLKAKDDQIQHLDNENASISSQLINCLNKPPVI